jgi:sulfite exporter TauE/SafE
LGAILGIIGQGFEMAGFRNILQLLWEFCLLLWLYFHLEEKILLQIPFFQIFIQSKIEFGKTASKGRLPFKIYDRSSEWFFTLRNGLYGFNASLASGGIWQGALYMALFGLGTLPFMFAVVLVGNLMNQAFRVKVLKVPVIMIILGGLLFSEEWNWEFPIFLQSRSYDHFKDQNGAVNCH